MAEKKSIYKDGKRNKHGYKINRRKIKEQITFTLIIIGIVFSLGITILEKLDIVDWTDIKVATGGIDGADLKEDDFAIYYLDVGQSDCTIVKSGNLTMMIDSGTGDQIVNIKESLKSLKIDVIDYLVLTHPHEDHIGGAKDVIEYCTVKNVIMPRLSAENMVTTYCYESLLEAIAEHNINAIAAEPGFKFSLNNASVHIFAPLQQDENLNNMSIVLKIVYGETSFMFQGDAEKKVENALLKEDFDLTADVLKVGHHGSNTSSVDKYLKAVNPEVAIISCGKDNNYGHPHDEVLERIDNNDIDPYVTALSGNITLVSDGQSIKISTEEGNEFVYD